MKTYQRIQLAALFFAALGATPGSFAATESTNSPQTPAGPHRPAARERPFDPEKRLARMTTHLALTADQQAKLRPLLAAEAEAMQTLDATALTRAQRRKQMRELRQANRAKIAAILTPEQREKLAQARHKGGHRHHGPAADAQPPAPTEE